MAKKTKQEDIATDEIILTDKEVLELELKAERKRAERITLEKNDGEIKTQQLHIANTKLILEKQEGQLEKIRIAKVSQMNSYKQKDTDYKQYVEYLADKYKIGDSKWGYDPDSGKVVIGNTVPGQ